MCAMLTEPTPKHKIPLTFIIAAVVVIAAGVWLMMSRRSTSTTTGVVTTATPVITGAPTPPKETKLSFEVVEPATLILTGGYADPTVVPMTGGYRMYVNKFGNGPSGYVTYTSKDGATWTKEKTTFVISGPPTSRKTDSTPGKNL
jgi:hypothetical protein